MAYMCDALLSNLRNSMIMAYVCHITVENLIAVPFAKSKV